MNEKNYLEKIYQLRGKINYLQLEEIFKFYGIKRNYLSIYVVGTNGKGSLCWHLNENLIRKGLSVGKFTSPHILRFNERITFNNEEISFSSFYEISQQLLTDFAHYQIGFFTVMMIVATIYFEKFNLDCAIYEAGIGSLTDPCNLMKHQVGICTSIGFDHEKILGKTLSLIAYHKSYFIKDNMQIFLPLTIRPKQLKIFKTRFEKTKKSCLVMVNNRSKNYQKSNQILAAAVLKRIFSIQEPVFSVLTGRTSKIFFNKQDIIIDVGHNFSGIKASLELIKKNGWKFEQILFSLTSGKNLTKIKNLLNGYHVFAYELKCFKAMSKIKLQEYFEVVDNLDIFLRKLSKPTLFIGSFFLISEVLNKIQEIELK